MISVLPPQPEWHKELPFSHEIHRDSRQIRSKHPLHPSKPFSAEKASKSCLPTAKASRREKLLSLIALESGSHSRYSSITYRLPPYEKKSTTSRIFGCRIVFSIRYTSWECIESFLITYLLSVTESTTIHRFSFEFSGSIFL